MEKCCPGMDAYMEDCMEGCKLGILIPLILSIFFFFIGYFLAPEIVRILWLLFSGLVVVIGVIGFIMMLFMVGRNTKE